MATHKTSPKAYYYLCLNYSHGSYFWQEPIKERASLNTKKDDLAQIDQA